METKFTKGKWTQSIVGFYTNDGQTAVLCGEKRICMVDVQDESIKRKDLYFATCEEREANARLISAAPELLTALIEVKKLIDWWAEDGYIESKAAKKELDLINNAIKKAIK